MMEVGNHYRTLLAPIYCWSSGGRDAALAAGADEVKQLGLPKTAAAIAVDLGAGFGKHAIPLARAGWHVTAIDSSSLLLEQLRRDATQLSVSLLEANLMDFRQHVRAEAELIVCLGDTITHLPDADHVWRLLRDVASTLCPGGRFVVTLRDYSAPPTGSDRFIVVRADDNRILTCFLEEARDHMIVHDLVHERADNGWRLHASRYAKLRLRPEALRAAMEALGMRVVIESGPRDLVRLTATKLV